MKTFWLVALAFVLVVPSFASAAPPLRKLGGEWHLPGVKDRILYLRLKRIKNKKLSKKRKVYKLEIVRFVMGSLAIRSTYGTRQNRLLKYYWKKRKRNLGVVYTQATLSRHPRHKRWYIYWNGWNGRNIFRGWFSYGKGKNRRKLYIHWYRSQRKGKKLVYRYFRSWGKYRRASFFISNKKKRKAIAVIHHRDVWSKKHRLPCAQTCSYVKKASIFRIRYFRKRRAFRRNKYIQALRKRGFCLRKPGKRGKCKTKPPCAKLPRFTKNKKLHRRLLTSFKRHDVCY